MKKETKREFLTAKAIAMVRAGIGYIIKETLLFAFEDTREGRIKMRKTANDFAKKQNAHYVEVWYHDNNAWDTMILCHTKHFLPDRINAAKLDN